MSRSSSSRQVKRFIRQARDFVIPVLMFGFLVLGGSNQQSPAAVSLILLGSAVMGALILLSWTPEESRGQKYLYWILGILGAVSAYAVFQLFPMPAWWMNALPGRAEIYADWRLLGIQENFTSISLSPESTVAAALSIIIPLSAILLVYRIGWSSASKYLPWALTLSGALTVAFGLAQILVGQDGSLYQYADTSDGQPVGFFANVNHQASFILMTVPFTAYLVNEIQAHVYKRDEEIAIRVALGALMMFQVVGILAAGSLAGYLLLLPTLGLSYLVAFAKRGSMNGRTGTFILAGLAASILVVASSPILEGIGVTSLSDDETSRIGIYTLSLEIWGDHFLFGSGLGTFEQVYRLYENAEGISPTYINLAHNDYLQWVIEMGLVGLVIMGATFAVLGRQFYLIWSIPGKDSASRLRRAASIAVLVAVLHSFVDYPARTPSILFLLAICISLMFIQQKPARTRSSTDLAKHNMQRI